MNTQICPAFCESQIPARYFSRFDVESYRLCGLVGLIAGADRSEGEAPSAALRLPRAKVVEGQRARDGHVGPVADAVASYSVVCTPQYPWPEPVVRRVLRFGVQRRLYLLNLNWTW
jgi:hypothetical protein